MKGLPSTLATIWRLAAPYFRSEDKWAGRVLLASVIAIELALVAVDVMINQWYNRFYNALQDRNWDAFVSELLFFCGLAAAFVVLAVYQLYLNQWLQIRWRQWMTKTYLDDWLGSSNHYRMQLLGDAADNPDQRIAEDIRLFVEKTLEIGIGLLSAVVTLGSFVVILWILSAAAPLHLFGANWTIPGYLVWAALAYAIVGTALTHLIGRPLARLNFNQQRYEADFRFSLVRVRENSEQIALLDGEAAESDRLMTRFARLANNWFGIMSRTKKLTFFTAGYRQASTVFPFVVVSPAYFAGAVQLGGLMQTASAFNSVQNALSFFVTAYRSLAEWRAVIDRLEGFEQAVAAGRAAAVTPPRVEVTPAAGGKAIALHDLAVALPNGAPLVMANGIAVAAGDRVLVTGPSGAGKSTLFRAIARRLAVRPRPRGSPARRARHDAAAASLLPGWIACRRARLPGRARRLQPKPDRRSAASRRPAGAGRAPIRRGALEPHAVARRAATARHRPRPLARASMAVPRRGHRIAR